MYPSLSFFLNGREKPKNDDGSEMKTVKDEELKKQ